MRNKKTSDFLNDISDTNPPVKAGGNKEKCESVDQLDVSVENSSPKWDIMRSQKYVTHNCYNVDVLEKPRIDNSKLLIPLHVDRSKYETHEELYKAVVEWWIDIKDRSPKTINARITNARNMAKHSIYPVDWIKFEPEQIINQLIYRQKIEYKELQKNTGNPTYGYTQLNNFWKAVNTFAQAYGIDISYWGWSPPSPPEPQVKIVPRPIIVNKLIHHWYTNNRFENALIRTLLTIGFQSGLRPGELITIKVDNVKLNEGYIFITEQKKKFRERQVWLEDDILNRRQQNSLKNYIDIWRPRAHNRKSGNILFIQKDGKPFPSEDALRMYLAPFVKPVWNDFKPKIMRDWSAIARLIRTKVETNNFDTKIVQNALGHKYEKTTENYIKYAENYYRKDPYDWLRAVLKFHKNSKRMRRLMGKDNGPSQKQDPKILTNKMALREQKVWLRRSTGGKLNGPGGANGLFLLLKILTNSARDRFLIRLYYSIKPFLYSFTFSHFYNIFNSNIRRYSIANFLVLL